MDVWGGLAIGAFVGIWAGVLVLEGARALERRAREQRRQQALTALDGLEIDAGTLTVHVYQPSEQEMAEIVAEQVAQDVMAAKARLN